MCFVKSLTCEDGAIPCDARPPGVLIWV